MFKLKLFMLFLLLLGALAAPLSAAADSIRLRFDAVVRSAPDHIAQVGEHFNGSFWYETPGDQPFRYAPYWPWVGPYVRHLDYETEGGIHLDFAAGSLVTRTPQEIEITDYVASASSNHDRVEVRANWWFWDIEIVLGGDGSAFFESLGIDAPVIPTPLAEELPFFDYATGYVWIENFLGTDFVAEILPGSIAPWGNDGTEWVVNPEPSSGLMLLLGLFGLALRPRARH